LWPKPVRPGQVTISTNMAGRGTDIKLGEGVADLAASISWGRSGMRAGASTISSAAVRGGRGYGIVEVLSLPR